MTDPRSINGTENFLAGDGEMAARMSAYDWSASLGPIASWPQSLKTTVSLMVHSPVPLVLLWGEDGIMLYNDAYSVFAGGRHPQLLGSKVREGWPEVADFNDNVMKVGLAGGTLSYKDRELTLNRRGQPEAGWMDLFYSPVIDESGKPGGVIAMVVETTERVLAERGMQTQSARLAQMFQNAPSFMCQMEGPEHVFTFTNASYQQLTAHRDVIGKSVRQALPEIAGQGFFELLDQVYATGESFRGSAVPVILQRTPGADPEERILDFIYQPVRDAAGQITGIFSEGTDVTERMKAEAALRESGQRLRFALDAAAMGSFVWRVDDDMAEGDARMMALFGLPQDGLLTLKTALADSIDDRDGPRYAAAVTRACDPAGDGILREDIRIRLPDGRERWLAITGQIAFGGEPRRAIQMAGAARDITASRQAENRRAALVELADRIRDDSDPDALTFAAAEILGRTLNVSRAGYGTVDTKAETITIARDWNAPGVTSLAGVLQFRDYGSYIEDLKRGETVVFADAQRDPRTRQTAAALERISARAVVNMPVSEDGGLVALLYLNHATAREWTADELTFIREIAERTRTAVGRLQAEADLRANMAQFEGFAQAVPNHVWASNPHGQLNWFNQQTLDYSGMALAALAGDGWGQIVHPEDVAGAASAWKRALVSGQNYETEFRIRRADGIYRWHVVRALPIRGADGVITRWVGTNTDIHDQKVVAEALSEESTALDLLNRSATNVAAELDLDRVVQMVVDTGVALTGAQFGAFFYNVIDTKGESYMLYALSGVDRSHFDKFPMPRNTAVFAPTFNGEGVVRSGDITKDPRYGKNKPRKGMPEGHLPVRSYLAVPVTSRTGDVIGGLFFGHADTDKFDGRAERLMSGLAAHAAIGIDNARLFQASQRLNQTLEERVAERTAKLERSEAQMRSIVETTHIYQGLLDLEGRVENANTTALAGIDAELEDVFGKPYWETLWFTGTPGMPEAVREAVEMVRQGQTFRREMLLKLPTGERWLDFAMRPLLDEKDQVIALVPEAADITERRQAEDALRQAQKMEAVGQLTGGIAHDFNNLLQGITGALDRVQYRIAQGRMGDVDRFLKAAIESANRAGALTHRLLAFSRRQTLDPRPTDANRLIGGMEELIRRTMGPNIAVEVVGAGGLWPIRVDPSQLENSLLNLCINARDAMPDGGTLTIETANKWLDDRAARDRELPPGQYVTLCVTDSGTGMTPEVIARAFDPFFTTKPLGQGTGLGLSMIYGFVRQSGGQVRIYSEIGKGTTMCLYFPRYSGKVEDEAHPGSELVERGFGETVLVVDDEPTVRMLVAEVLSESFYNIIEAGDGPSALKILESDRRIDLMITDVGLPGGMNGRQVADAARVLRKDLKVLFITGYAENAAVGNGHLDAGMEILAKPFAMSTLANKVREMIER